MTAADDLLSQPYSAMDLAAFFAGLMALLFAALWQRERVPGMGWFAASMLLLAGWMATNRWHLPVGTAVPQSYWNVVPALTAATLTIGMARFLPLAPRWRQLCIVVAIVLPIPYVAVMVYAVFTGAPMQRDVVNLLLMGAYLQLAAMCLWGARHEPGAGFGWVGLCLLAVVPMVVGLAVANVHGVVLRYWAVLPVVAMQPMLLTVVPMRRRVALEAEIARRAAAERTLTELNASLEQQVAQRTNDLLDMVNGLESFNRNVSHDLRGPLGGIAGAASLAEQALSRADTAAASRLLSAITMQATRSSELVDALLRLARVRNAPVRLQRVDVGELARDVIDQVRLASQSSAFPRIEVMPCVPVDADPELLRMILTNLITNAVKFTRDVAEPRIQVGAQPIKRGVEVFVRDNGVGFEPQQADKLFQPFHRLHGAAYDGSGVGLSIVQRAVAGHGGRVWAQASVQGGASFHFTLPDPPLA